jgi:hypothetical protein
VKLLFNSVFCKARFRRRTSHVPNLIDELGAAEERRMNQLRPPLHEPGLIFNPGQHATGGYFFILFT